MKYVNSETGKTIELGALSSEESLFWREAQSRFKRNENWINFENFAFGLKSPIYRRMNRQIKLRDFPLFQALKDMHLHLGVQQGAIYEEQKFRSGKRTAQALGR